MKAGYLYVLTHPSDPDIYKVGLTTRQPEKRLAQHNSNYREYTGRLVKETGQKWELRTFIAVPDVVRAEAAFWGATRWADIPFRHGVEIEKMPWEEVQAGLAAAQKAGVRPPPGPLPDYIYANNAWMNERLEGRGIRLVGNVHSRLAYGKARLRCSNGHEWRSSTKNVAEGEGCPTCGMGEASAEEIAKKVKAGYLCLLVHPQEPGFIKIGLTCTFLEQAYNERTWGDWEVHRYRYVDDPALAESLIWDLLGCPRPDHDQSVRVDLGKAEQAVRELIPRLQSEIARRERAKVPSAFPVSESA
ncbi:MAG: GIY-YIG nuclease family protein [Planctomycetota bacterium]